MGIFANQAELRACFTPLFEWARYQKSVGQQLRERRVVLQWQYNDPDDMVTLAALEPSVDTQAYFDVVWGQTVLAPHAVLSMSADIAHRYFLNQVPVMAALVQREIAIAPLGRLPLVFQLLPCILPLIGEYPRILREIDRADLLPKGAS